MFIGVLRRRTIILLQLHERSARTDALEPITVTLVRVVVLVVEILN